MSLNRDRDKHTESTTVTFVVHVCRGLITERHITTHHNTTDITIVPTYMHKYMDMGLYIPDSPEAFSILCHLTSAWIKIEV